jgi:hypothetical protein
LNKLDVFEKKLIPWNWSAKYVAAAHKFVPRPLKSVKYSERGGTAIFFSKTSNLFKNLPPLLICAAATYFADQFQGINKTRNREIYIHYTNATDPKMLQVTMASVQNIISRMTANPSERQFS